MPIQKIVFYLFRNLLPRPKIAMHLVLTRLWLYEVGRRLKLLVFTYRFDDTYINHVTSLSASYGKNDIQDQNRGIWTKCYYCVCFNTPPNSAELSG